ncbi:hypothetical protein [Actinoplanes derwentensis]|uniref:hypothetical protein n=1 Tax=Actinoplanes derwentensis TaxID=113562 RepID=UPI0012FDB334|nr:hypothetical protein [Actinoplanes derwentensis]GID87481.1 hypothetical protein Ade03nite_64050 [Actinoplanes derwentensis]
MGSREIIVRVLPGELPQRGIVVQRGKTASTSVVVRWDDGSEERVRPGDQSVGYATEESVCAQWLLEPGAAAEAFEANPVHVFTEFIRDSGKITKTMLLRRTVVAGVSESLVKTVYTASRAALRADPHIQISNESHTWNDAPIDPYADLRSLTPHEALDRLAGAKSLRQPERAALADAVRTGLSPRS